MHENIALCKCVISVLEKSWLNFCVRFFCRCCREGRALAVDIVVCNLCLTQPQCHNGT